MGYRTCYDPIMTCPDNRSRRCRTTSDALCTALNTHPIRDDWCYNPCGHRIQWPGAAVRDSFILAGLGVFVKKKKVYEAVNTLEYLHSSNAHHLWMPTVMICTPLTSVYSHITSFALANRVGKEKKKTPFRAASAGFRALCDAKSTRQCDTQIHAKQGKCPVVLINIFPIEKFKFARKGKLCLPAELIENAK